MLAVMSMPPLPAPLAEALLSGAEAAPKRERTRRQLLLAALQIYVERGVAGATLQDIAAAAGVAGGTIYNYFPNREEVAQEVAQLLLTTLCERISASYADNPRGIERMAIGNRRYMWLAAQSPAWALLLLDVSRAVPSLVEAVQAYALADLRLGVAQGSFQVVSEAAAMDLVRGTITSALQSIALGHAPAGHDVAVTATVLRGLGVPPAEADRVAALPLPPFPAPESQPAAPARQRRGATPHRAAGKTVGKAGK